MAFVWITEQDRIKSEMAERDVAWALARYVSRVLLKEPTNEQ